ncbi:MAG: hypothetical protein WBW33_07215 [Bryobacteraceae bacterium]
MENDAASTPVLRRLLVLTSVLLLMGVAYVCWIFYSRAQNEQKAQQEAAQREQQRLRSTTDLVFGSGEVKILTFGLAPAHPRRGETINMCYGVANAVSVSLEPEFKDAKPSYNHCLQVAPVKDTTYTLTAKDGKGHSVSASLTVHVQ